MNSAPSSTFPRRAISRPCPPAPLAIGAGDAGTINTLADAFVGWFDKLIDEPVTPDENAADFCRVLNTGSHVRCWLKQP